MILLDVSHTSHTRAQTGIQRVVRSVATGLGRAATPITYDPYCARWRTLDSWEVANLRATAPGKKRGAHWPLRAIVRGHIRRLLGPGGAVSRGSNPVAALLVPEVFSSAVAAALPGLFAQTTAPRVAVFHDAIALKLPELSPAKTVARFPGYLCELLGFDAIAAVSDDSREALVDYWRWLGLSDFPLVRTIPLGIDLPPPPGTARTNAATGAAGGTPILLSVGSIEGRKNHLALLDACEELWARGRRFQLRLVGHLQRETGIAASARIRALQASGRPLRFDGAVDEPALAAAYAECAFTIYPSLMEGFGLPVLESVAHGKPCICSAHGALGEAVRGGGGVPLDRVDAEAIAAAIDHLLTDRAALEQLSIEARGRELRTWRDYAAEITDWIRSLPRRSTARDRRS